jgi:ketosteroid isomerase-like protein
MSEENVEIVRTALREFTETQQLSKLVSPDLVWDLRSWPDWTGQSVYHGPDGFMKFFAEWTDAYEDWTQEFESLIDAGGSDVVVTTVQRGRLAGSESWVDLRAAFIYTVEDGLITRTAVYASPEKALEAAGLSE